MTKKQTPATDEDHKMPLEAPGEAMVDFRIKIILSNYY